MFIFDYLYQNSDIMFYGLYASTACFLGYSFATSYLNSFYVDKGVQTDAWENYSDRPSLIGPESVTSLDTVTPISENISPIAILSTNSEIGIQTITEGASTVTTVLPIPPMDIPMVPNR